MAVGHWVFRLAIWHVVAGLSHPLDFSSLAGMWEGLGCLSRSPKGLHFKIGKQNTAAASVLGAPASLLAMRIVPAALGLPSCLQLLLLFYLQMAPPSPQPHGPPAGSGSRKAQLGAAHPSPSPLTCRSHLFWMTLFLTLEIPPCSVLGPHPSFHPQGCSCAGGVHAGSNLSSQPLYWMPCCPLKSIMTPSVPVLRVYLVATTHTHVHTTTTKHKTQNKGLEMNELLPIGQ